MQGKRRALHNPACLLPRNQISTRKNEDERTFGYYDGGKQAHDPAVQKRLVIIGAALFFNDVVHAVSAFLEGCNLRTRVEG